MNFMGIFSHLGVKTKVEFSLIIIASILLALLLAMFIVTAVIRETGAIGCKKVPYGPGHEGKCGDSYFAVSVSDSGGVLRNPETAPTSGYMICCRAMRQ